METKLSYSLFGSYWTLFFDIVFFGVPRLDQSSMPHNDAEIPLKVPGTSDF